MSSKDKKCYLIQNRELLADETPDSLKNLSYGIYPDSKSYNDNRFIYNKIFNYFPLAIYYVRNYQDISYLIKQFVANNSKFTIRCGGHAYEPASLSSGFIIDVKNINGIKIDKINKTAKIGSGTKLGAIVDVLSKYKMTTSLGDSSCVGISGLSLAGGKGFLTRLYGMVCDNIISIQAVNYEGKLIKIDKNNYPDLLWAYKGAGICNFGVVYEIEMKLYNDIYAQLEDITWDWNADNVKNVLKIYQKWILEIPDNITSDINLMYNNGTATFTIKFYKYGECVKNHNFDEINCFKEYGNPTVSICKGYFSQISDCWVNYDTGKSQPFSKMKSTMIFKPNYSDEYLSIYTDSIERLIESKLNVVFQYNFTQVGGKVSDGNSCYFPKDAIIALTIFCTWGTENLTNCCRNFTNFQTEKITKYTSKYVFPNMIDYDLDDYMDSYYGCNKNKLIEIKNKYDPNNVFNWNQSIPLH